MFRQAFLKLKSPNKEILVNFYMYISQRPMENIDDFF